MNDLDNNAPQGDKNIKMPVSKPATYEMPTVMPPSGPCRDSSKRAFADYYQENSVFGNASGFGSDKGSQSLWGQIKSIFGNSATPPGEISPETLAKFDAELAVHHQVKHEPSGLNND